MKPPAKQVGVLASGSGSNFQALVDAGVPIAVLICNVPGARCLERAKAAGVPAELLDHRGFPTREAWEEAVISALRTRHVEVVCLAGLMRLLTPKFLAAFPQAVLNVHPALLPSFPGSHGARDALAYGAKVTGCTVHLVDDGVDTGPIVAQAAVPVFEADDEATLQQRIQREEHRLYPQAVRALLEGRVSVQGRRVTVREATQ